MNGVVKMTGTETTKCFADRLQDLIAESGKDVKTLADEIGVSSGALSKYQNDKGEPGISALYKIANYFGVTADYLIGLSNNKTVENASIGQMTGLSDDAITVLKVAFEEKRFFIKKGKILKFYWSDILSMLIENLDYFPSTASYLVDFFTISADQERDDDEIGDELIEKSPELYEKIQKHGALLMGTTYRNYLLRILKDEFMSLLSYMQLKVEPQEFLSDSDKWELKFRGGNALSKYSIVRMQHWDEWIEEGVLNADNTEEE